MTDVESESSKRIEKLREQLADIELPEADSCADELLKKHQKEYFVDWLKSAIRRE